MKKKNKKDYINPVTITKDVWFYPMPKKLDFTVYIGQNVTLFSISKKKLLKYLNK